VREYGACEYGMREHSAAREYGAREYGSLEYGTRENDAAPEYGAHEYGTREYGTREHGAVREYAGSCEYRGRVNTTVNPTHRIPSRPATLPCPPREHPQYG